MLKLKAVKQQKGFTLVEVLVAILIAILFVNAAMQAMVIAAILKVRSQDSDWANALIQQELEQAKYAAATYQYATLTTDASPSNRYVIVSSDNGFAIGDKVRIGSDTTEYTIQSISNTAGIVLLNFTANLVTTQPKNSPVFNPARCGTAATLPTIDTGFADGLRDNINGSDQSSNFNFVDIPKKSRTNKQFRMRRTTRILNSTNFTVLGIEYEITASSGGKSLAKVYTELIPNAAFQCPPL